MSNKFGVSIGFLSALFVFTAWYSPVAMIILTVLVLIFADEEIVKRNVLNAFFFSMIFLVAGLCLGKISSVYQNSISNFLNWKWFSIFDNDTYNVFTKLDFAGYINKFVDLVKLVIAIIFMIIGLKSGEVKIPLCDSLAKKAMQIIR
ncbi:MAG: hypothetical protein K5776_09740 [Lachnospiraceae bacterium]|nr:hypothetical protein [Lachnospiraceae bacterium]